MTKFYAVRNGRDGPQIYTSWSDADRSVTGFPGARHKSFKSEFEARTWLESGRVQEMFKREPSQPTEKWQKLNSHPSGSTGNVSDQLTKTNIKPDGNQPVKSIEYLEDDSKAKLSPDQQEVFDAIRSKQSLFFTGSAGTGKSFLLRKIIKYLKENGKIVAVTASTGIAASNLKGKTLHSFAGVGLGKEPVKKLIWIVRNSRDSFNRWKMTDVLIIDEISMVDGGLLDKLEYIARSIRQNEDPFGGIQLILAGDFFQLPPVSQGVQQLKYAFQASCWIRCVPIIITLKHVFRQKDQVFVDLLNEMRTGLISEKNKILLKSLSRPVKYHDEIVPTRLYPKKEAVKKANQIQLDRLKSPARIFKSKDKPGDNCTIPFKEIIDKLNKQLLVQTELALKINAQVMLIKNMPDHGLVNGSVGIVIGFDDEPKYWPTESHETRPGRGKGNPVVKFTTGTTLTLSRISFDLEASNGTVLASREQLPLILAWALSIHKSQGQTLERVIVDLKNSFEMGQVYVALSRATSLDSLQVIGFDSRLVRAHPVVLDWAQSVGCD